VDNLVQATLVTASGEHLTANAHINSDLFWSIRGGGGGTYGVLTSATYQTHPSLPASASFFVFNFTNLVAAKKLTSEFIHINPSLVDAGFGGYAFITNATLAGLFLAPNVSLAVANATWQPFFDFAQNLTSQGVVVTANFVVSYDSFYAWYKQLFSSNGEVGQNTEIASRLLSRTLVEKNYENVADTMLNIDGITWQCEGIPSVYSHQTDEDLFSA
jgi:FAD/FMN-containing dehydrogenase